MTAVCPENCHHAQKFQKQAYNKNFKPINYVFGDKVGLKNKYIKIK